MLLGVRVQGTLARVAAERLGGEDGGESSLGLGDEADAGEGDEATAGDEVEEAG